MSRLSRSHTGQINVTIGSSSSNASDIAYADISGGIIYGKSGITSCTLTFYTKDSAGNLYQVCDSTGAGVTVTLTQNTAVPIPVECFGCEWLRIVASAGGPLSTYLSLKG